MGKINCHREKQDVENKKEIKKEKRKRMKEKDKDILLLCHLYQFEYYLLVFLNISILKLTKNKLSIHSHLSSLMASSYHTCTQIYVAITILFPFLKTTFNLGNILNHQQVLRNLTLLQLYSKSSLTYK